LGLSVQIDGGGKDFELVEDMIQGGTLVDIVDKGMCPNKFKPNGPDGKPAMQHKCYFVWLMSEEDSDGKNKRVFESFTVSMNEKATLRKRLKEFGLTQEKVDELKAAGKAVELDSYIGTKRMIVLSREDGDNGKPFIKVTATMQLKKGQTAPDIPADFQRKQDRQD
jgi:hypothetical protein